MGLKDVWAGVIEYLRGGTMNNVALITAPAGRDEQYLNSYLSTRSKGASGGLPRINMILKIQFTCPNANPYPTNAFTKPDFQCT